MDLFFAGISNFQAVLCYPQMMDITDKQFIKTTSLGLPSGK